MLCWRRSVAQGRFITNSRQWFVLPGLALILLRAESNAQAPARLDFRPDFVVDQWTTDNGLPQNTITGIAQAPDGYLWLSTFGGLVRFDGVRFTVFTSQTHPGIGSDRMLGIQVDSAGTLWVGTEDGLVRYAGGKFTTLRTSDGLPGNEISALRADTRGTLWVGVVSGGIARLSAGRVVTIGRAQGLPDGQIYTINEPIPGQLQVVVGDRSVMIDARTLAISPAEREPAGLEQLVHSNPGGRRWYRGRDALYTRERGPLERYPNTLGFDPMQLRVVQHSGDDDWFGAGYGVVRLTRAPRAVVQRYPLPSGRTEYSVLSLFLDREGTLWAGTNDEGLLRFRRRLFTVLTRAHGLSSDNPLALLSDRRGRVLVGSNCDSTAVIDHDRVRIEPRGDKCVFAMAEAPDGALWFGTYGGGVVRLDARTTRHWSSREGLSEVVVLALLADAGGSVWAGTRTRGLNLIQNGRVTRVYTTRDGLPHDGIRYLMRDRAGVLWVGTLGGVARMDGDRFTAFTTAQGLSHNHVRAIYQDGDGTMWIGSYGGGLTRMRDGKLTSITTANGMFDDIVSAILEDASGNLWMSGNRGIFRVSRAQLNDFADGRASSVHSVSYGKADGLISPETNGGFQPAALRTPDGRMWFPTIKGLAVVDPATATANPVAPGLVVEEIVIDGVSRRPEDGLRIPPEARRIEIRYTGLSSPAPEHIVFRHRLEEIDRDWVYAGGARVAHYTRLPAGNYRFRLDAANRDGVWQGGDVGVAFTVLPYFWNTWWFRALVAVALVGAAASAWRGRTRRHAQALAAQQELTRRFIDGQEIERKRIAGELHDSVGQGLLVVKNRAAMALRAGSLAEAQEHMQEIADSATDTLRETREIARNLRPAQLDRLGLSVALKSAVERAAESSGIRFSVHVNDLDGLMDAQLEIGVFRVVQESVNNVLKHSQAESATVAVGAEDGVLRITVADDGRGIADIDRASADGFGLAGIAERVRLMGGEYELHSEPGAGTTVLVTIPVHAPVVT